MQRTQTQGALRAETMAGGMNIDVEIVAAYRALRAEGLIVGSAGNVSLRCGDAMLITPSGASAETLDATQLVTLPLDRADVKAVRPKPSSEWRFHRDIYIARPDAGAIVHTHAPYCTAFAMLRRAIPAAHYMIAAFGGPDVRCTDYAPYGTQDLSDLAVKGLIGRKAVLLGNHGMIVIGDDMADALARAIDLEALARTTHLALSLGAPVILPDEEIARTVERFKSYGRNAQETAKN